MDARLNDYIGGNSDAKEVVFFVRLFKLLERCRGIIRTSCHWRNLLALEFINARGRDTETPQRGFGVYIRRGQRVD